MFLRVLLNASMDDCQPGRLLCLSEAPYGALAEKSLVNSEHRVTIPDGLDDATAAAIAARINTEFPTFVVAKSGMYTLGQGWQLGCRLAWKTR